VIGTQNGTTGPSTAITIGQWVRFRADFSNQASDAFFWGSFIGQANAGNGAGHTGRTVAGNAGSKINGTFWEVLYLKNAFPTTLQQSRYDAYVYGRTNGVVQI
jgi:hypothetical protein